MCLEGNRKANTLLNSVWAADVIFILKISLRFVYDYVHLLVRTIREKASCGCEHLECSDVMHENRCPRTSLNFNLKYFSFPRHVINSQICLHPTTWHQCRVLGRSAALLGGVSLLFS